MIVCTSILKVQDAAHVHCGSFPINWGFSIEMSPTKWETPQFFSRFADCIAQSCRGRTSACPYFDAQDTNNGVAVAMCSVV